MELAKGEKIALLAFRKPQSATRSFCECARSPSLDTDFEMMRLSHRIRKSGFSFYWAQFEAEDQLAKRPRIAGPGISRVAIQAMDEDDTRMVPTFSHEQERMV